MTFEVNTFGEGKEPFSSYFMQPKSMKVYRAENVALWKSFTCAKRVPFLVHTL